MIRGLYSGTSGMHAAQIQSDVISDNIANISTPGYKRDDSSNKVFADMLLERTALNAGIPERTVIGSTSTGVVVERALRSTLIGALQRTDIRTDLAFTSQGFFSVQTPNGERYTRNGHFEVNSAGMLQTSEGHLVLGENGPIGPLSNTFVISKDGTVSDQGQIIGRLKVVNLLSEAMRREGQSLYYSLQPAQQLTDDFAIQQGALEASNVDITDQTTKMMSVMRAYEANQKVLQTQDSTLEKAVNEIGKI